MSAYLGDLEILASARSVMVLKQNDKNRDREQQQGADFNGQQMPRLVAICGAMQDSQI